MCHLGTSDRGSRSALYHGESSVEATTSMTWVLTSNVGKGSAGARRGSVCHPTRKGGASAFWRSTPPSTLIGRPEAKVGGDTARGSVFRPIHRGGGKEEGGGALCCGCSRRRSPRGRRSRRCIYSMRVVLPLVLGI